MKSRKDALLASVSVPILLFMAIWVFIFPGSYRAGWQPGHEALLARLSLQPSLLTPYDILTKYAPYTDVKLTHLLPSGLWSVCGALQLMPRLRATAPFVHRLSGRVMLACSVLITLGYLLMEFHGLVKPPPYQRSSGDSKLSLNTAFLVPVAAWFVFTAAMALIHARSRRYLAHSRWAVRHVASGGWVIVQRLMIMTLSQGAAVLGWAWSEYQRHEMFLQVAVLAIVVCFWGAEVYVRQGGPGAARASMTEGGAAATVATAARAAPGVLERVFFYLLRVIVAIWSSQTELRLQLLLRHEGASPAAAALCR